MSIKWNDYHVTIRLQDRLIGGIPVVPPEADRADAYERWARGQGVVNDPSFEKPLHEALAEEPDMPISLENIAGLETGFRSDEEGIYVEARQLKACLREAAQRLGIIKNVRGSRQVIQHDLHVRNEDGTQKLRFFRDGNQVVEADGRDQRPISVVTQQGPRTAIKRFSYVQHVDLTFIVKILADGVGRGIFDEDRLKQTLEMGGWLGLGADRSQGEGVFQVLEVELIEDEETS